MSLTEQDREMIKASLRSRAESEDAGAEAALALIVELEQPVEMLLFCPRCGRQHVDAPSGAWLNPPHSTHTCAGCRLNWRPSNRPTTGVKALLLRRAEHFSLLVASNPSIHLRFKGRKAR